MRAVLQRVSSASVTVDGAVVGAVDSGVLILLGVAQGDSEEESCYIAKKSVELRIFSDEDGRMNRSIGDIGGKALIVSQFTLLADWKKGRRPGFTKAAAPDEGKRLYEHFCDQVRSLGIEVATGIFGADMKVSLLNDGPVTIILDTKEL